MADAEAFIESVLQHGQSIYDPVKAHQYYLRTRQLKGRRPTLRGTKQKEGWAYVQSVAGEQKKAALTAASEAHKKAVAQLRANGQAQRQALSDQLRSILETIPRGNTTDREAQKALISEQRDKVVSSIKSSLENAQANYQAAREAIKAKFEGKLDQEFENIRKNVR